MADLELVIKNKLIMNANKKRRLAFLKVTLFILVIFLILIAIFPNNYKISIIAISVLAFFLFKDLPKVGEGLRAGGRGELEALSILKKLDNSVAVINQVHIPFSFSSQKSQEFDFILITDAGLFVIEVKNFSGVVIGSEKEKKWKVKSKNKTIKFENPLNQLKREIIILRRFLSYYQLFPPIAGIVLFINPNCSFKIPKSLKKKIGTKMNILKQIHDFNKNNVNYDQEKVKELLNLHQL